MGQVFHWVTKFNPTAVAVALVAGIAFVQGMSLIADAIRASGDTFHITTQIDNKGDVKAFKRIGGNLVPIPVPKK